LAADGRRLVLLKRSSSQLDRIARLAALPNVVTYDIDVVPLAGIFDAEGIDAIVHLATYYVKHHRPEDVEPLTRSNIGFPLQLLEQARTHGVRCFINTGTFFEYRHQPLPVSEQNALSPYNLYAAVKTAFQGLLEHYAGKYALNAATLRLFTPYGPRDHRNKLIPHIIGSIMAGKPLILSEGLQRLDFVYVADIAEAYCRCLAAIKEMPPGHSIVNIGSGESHSIREVVAAVERITGREARVTWGEPAPDEIQEARADISKARELLGWAPRHDLATGLKQTVDHYQSFRG
jgi:nucleoside-diphosphate-sugar epimerase